MKTNLLFALCLVWSMGIMAQEAVTLSKAAEKTIAVPTTIDFQGRLHDSGGSPVNATLSMTFSLYTVASGGTAQWTEVRTVQVIDGLFQVKLGEVTPFNESHFSGTDRWLGIKVGAEAEMSPRTKFSSVGYAMQSIEWDPTWWEGGNPDSDIGRSGRVGIGTGDPTQTLDVAGTMFLRGHLFDYNNTSGTTGQVLSRGANGILWQNMPVSQWTTSGSNIYYNTGKVGVLTTAPRQQLSVGEYLDLYSGYANSPTRPSIRSSPNNNLIINAYDTGILYFNLDGGTGETRFYAGPGGAEILRLTSGGNLGIGTGSPTAQLHTTGTVRFQNLSGSVTRNLVVSSNGTLSIDMPITYSVGLNNDLGGYVFYVTPDGRHGLVVATQNQAINCKWFDAQNAISNPSNHNTAGKNFTDWRLPTKFELNLIYTMRTTIGGLGNAYYWSSTEDSSTSAYYQLFETGTVGTQGKTVLFTVRAVRSF